MYGYTTEGAGGSISSTEIVSGGSSTGTIGWTIAGPIPGAVYAVVAANINLTGHVFYQQFSFSTGGGTMWMTEGDGNVSSSIANGPQALGTLSWATGNAGVSAGYSVNWSPGTAIASGGQAIYNFNFGGYVCPSCTGWGVTATMVALNCAVSVVGMAPGQFAYSGMYFTNPASFWVSL
jgi:hypothetical protein